MATNGSRKRSFSNKKIIFLGILLGICIFLLGAATSFLIIKLSIVKIAKCELPHTDINNNSTEASEAPLSAASLETSSISSSYHPNTDPPNSSDNEATLSIPSEQITSSARKVSTIAKLTSVTTVPTTTTTSPPPAEDELDGSLQPTSYKLSLTVYLNNDIDESLPSYSIEGEVVIQVTAKREISEIKLHSKELEIRTMTISGDSLPELMNPKWSPEGPLLTADLIDGRIAANKSFNIRILYGGKIGNDKHGLFRWPIPHAENETQLAAMSNFMPKYARQMVPCFDDNKFRAKWDITIIHPKDMTAVSNSKQKMSNPFSDTAQRTEFETSPPIVPYQLALFVSNFINRTEKVGLHNVFAYAEKESSFGERGMNLIVETALRSLHFYEEVLNVSFCANDSSKTLNIVILNNWTTSANTVGVISENKHRFLSSVYESQNQLHVMFLVAHQWFGNLLSLQNFKETWLSEGFSLFYAHDCFQKHDNTGQMYALLLPKFYWILKEELESEPNPDGINENTLFNSSLAVRGAAIVSAIEGLLGHNLLSTIQSYFANYYNKPVSVVDFRQMLEEAQMPSATSCHDDRSVSQVIETWDKQKGHPIVAVSYINATHLSITQAPLPHTMPKNKTWVIPLYLSGEKEGDIEVKWLCGKEIIIESKSFINIVNTDGKGFYQVEYDARNWVDIIKQLRYNKTALSPSTRATLVADALAYLRRNSSISEETANIFMEFIGLERELFKEVFPIYLPHIRLLNKTYSYNVYKKLILETDTFFQFCNELRLNQTTICKEMICECISYNKERNCEHLYSKITEAPEYYLKSDRLC